MTLWRTRSLLSRSIALSTAVARWRAPGCRYPSSTSFVMTAKDATRRSKRTTTPPMPPPQMSPVRCFSRLCRKRLSRSGPFRTGLTRTRNRFPQTGSFDHTDLQARGVWRKRANIVARQGPYAAGATARGAKRVPQPRRPRNARRREETPVLSGGRVRTGGLPAGSTPLALRHRMAPRGNEQPAFIVLSNLRPRPRVSGSGLIFYWKSTLFR
jgi:hypothetical protein